MVGETQVTLLHLHRNRDKQRSRLKECQSDRTYRQLAVILWRSRTRLLIQHKERRSKRGEKERKRKQDIDVKHAAHNQTDKMKRR